MSKLLYGCGDALQYRIEEQCETYRIITKDVEQHQISTQRKRGEEKREHLDETRNKFLKSRTTYENVGNQLEEQKP